MIPRINLTIKTKLAPYVWVFIDLYIIFFLFQFNRIHPLFTSREHNKNNSVAFFLVERLESIWEMSADENITLTRFSKKSTIKQ